MIFPIKDNLRHIPIGLSMMLGVPFIVKNIVELDNLLFITNCNYWIIAFFGFILGFCSSSVSEKKGYIDNWENWALVVNNKGVSLIVFLFTLSPVILKLTNLTEGKFELNLIFYSYWFCGLNLFFFIILFKLLSPKVYGYSDYDDFFNRSETFTHLRKDTSKLITFLENKKAKKFEELNLSSDIAILETILSNEVTSSPDAFKILRERSSYTEPFKRTIVGFFILVPLYLLPIVFLANVIKVAKEGLSHLVGKGSYLNAIFGF